jgi:hypothetical protein
VHHGLIIGRDTWRVVVVVVLLVLLVLLVTVVLVREKIVQ